MLILKCCWRVCGNPKSSLKTIPRFLTSLDLRDEESRWPGRLWDGLAEQVGGSIPELLRVHIFKCPRARHWTLDKSCLPNECDKREAVLFLCHGSRKYLLFCLYSEMKHCVSSSSVRPQYTVSRKYVETTQNILPSSLHDESHLSGQVFCLQLDVTAGR